MSVPSKNKTLITVEGLKKHFHLPGSPFTEHKKVFAVDGVSFSIKRGETLGLVGESGCGKSTVGKVLMGLSKATEGSVKFEGHDLSKLAPAQMRQFRRRMQMIFQDPYSSLNARMPVKTIVGEPFVIHGTVPRAEIKDRVKALLDRVGLPSDAADKYPHEFSGGQRQRIGIARALALGPELIIGDEPVSALDVSIQAQIVNLMVDLQTDMGLSYLFISHDLAVVRHVSHRIAIMYLGKIVEYASTNQLFNDPKHPYTQALLSAVPGPNKSGKKRERIILKGDVPSPINPPGGCHFHTRCPSATERCKRDAPALSGLEHDRLVACHLVDS